MQGTGWTPGTRAWGGWRTLSIAGSCRRGRSGACFPSPSGRSTARATVGGEFPTLTLSVVPRVPSSPIAHVSASPPLIPDSRLSRVRLAASDVWVLSQRSLPLRPGGLSAHAHTPLIRMVYCTASQRLRLPPASSTESRVVSPTWPSLYREPLRLRWGVTPPRVVFPRPRPALPGPHRYSGLMRQTSPLSRPTLDGLVRESLQVAACPCWEEALPDVISSISVEVRGPVPRRASAVRLPVSSRRTSASPYMQEVRRAETPAMMATSMTNRFRGCQSFRDVQAPPLARPPGCSYRRGAKSSGQPGRLHHAKNVGLPTTNCGIATCLNRAIDTTGLAPARLRPSRPLHACACSARVGLPGGFRPPPLVHALPQCRAPLPR